MQLNSDILATVAPFFSTISHTPGRIRVRVSPKIKQLNLELGQIDKDVKSISGIKNVKFNQIIGSVTIEYDKEQIAPSFWDDLIAGKNSDEIMGIISNLKGDK